MKYPAYTIKIDNPCHEDWNQMQSTDTGKFCSHCQHSVLDFTKLTDSQVIAIIEKSKGELCGRINNHQLNRIMQQTGPTQNPALYKILAGMLLLAATNTLSGEKINEKPELAVVTESIINADNAILSNTDTIVLRGKVMDNTLDAIGFANVVIRENGKVTRTGTCTDFDGNFELKIHKDLLRAETQILVSYVGYKRQIIDIAQISQNNELTFILVPELQENINITIMGKMRMPLIDPAQNDSINRNTPK